jgi:hypothetical protein
MISHGMGITSSDKMFTISLIANLIKRHPRCVRLIHRKRKLHAVNQVFEQDPFKDGEPDPSKAKALKSSLWEIDALMKSEVNEAVRNYCKLFKGDISRKTNFFKCEEFAAIDPLDAIAQDLEGIDFDKEANIINKNLLTKYGIWKEPILKKRVAENIDLNPTNSKTMKLGEKYHNMDDVFTLDQ